ncbi:heavy metal translocating P-type ATPase [Epibacterium ulvae]|uniref:heavy metal translocating P-type ATPase n=1 Tax=Epibacterium ulvae TaxID=1156985 RepID=UPI003EBF0A0D
MSTHEYALPVTGLSCAGCAGRAERALKAAPGVLSAAVNFATATATVEVGAEASVGTLATAAADAGYPLGEAEVVFHIDGMHCGSCVGRIEAALLALNGVRAAHVALTDGSARVRYIAGSLMMEDLQATIQHAGYTATPREQGHTDDGSAQRKLLRDFWLALVLTIPVFVIEMGGHMVPAFHHLVQQTLGQTLSWSLQAVLVGAVLLGPGRRFFARGIPGLMRGAPDMNALVAIGTAAAFSYSLVATFLPGLLPGETVQVYYESAAVIVTLILLGRMLEARAKGRTGATIRALAELQPDTALVIHGDNTVETPIAQINAGDHVRLRPGERVAVDALVRAGTGDVDESMLSGEPLPVQKSVGDTVSAGTINGASVLEIAVTGVGRDTRLAQIIELVERAQGAKLPVQALVDRITLWFVPAVLVVALATVMTWLALGQGIAAGLVSGVAVLIIACPCAMGLATPTSIVVGLGRAAQMGVLFRKGTALQGLEDVRLVVFDKTGTLTKGRPTLTDLRCVPGWDRDTVLPLVAAVEAQSEHPIARAIVAAVDASELPQAVSVTAVPGQGVTARVAGQQVAIGRLSFVEAQAKVPDAWRSTTSHMAARGETPIAVVIDGQAAALISVSDPIRPDAGATVSNLRAKGIEVAMISGDAEGTARHVAAHLGIEIVHAECLPDQKLTALQELQSRFGRTAFVGDGINDAPALAASDCGIALGSGTDVAMEAAEVVLSSGNPLGVLRAIDISRATLRNIRQNLGWAFGYNILLIPVAAGILVPIGGPQLSPGLAAGAMAASSVLVLSNALRLRKLDPRIHDTEDAR